MGTFLFCIKKLCSKYDINSDWESIVHSICGNVILKFKSCMKYGALFVLTSSTEKNIALMKFWEKLVIQITLMKKG